MKMPFRTLALILASLVVAGCASTKGTISSGRYHSPLSNFSVPLPDWVGLKIQDQNDDDGGRVSFHGDFGNLWAITYVRLPGTSALVSDPGKRDHAYRGFLVEFAMPNLFRRASPQSRVLQEEFLYEGDSRAYFAVVSIPEGSALVDMQKGKRLDSTRALLIFGKNAYMYMLENEMGRASSLIDPSALSQATLKQIRERMTFK